MIRTTHYFALLLLLAAVGCQCGDRPRLLGRLRDRNRDDEPRGTDRGSERTPERRDSRDLRDPCCDDALPPPRTGTGYGGYPLSNGRGVSISPLSGIPYSPPLPAGSLPPSPGYPIGNPYTISGPRRDDELPNPGGYSTIPPTIVPATPRATDGSRLMFPPIGGGTMTGDPRK